MRAPSPGGRSDQRGVLRPEPVVGIKPACELTGRSRATVYRQRSPKPRVAGPRRPPAAHPAALSELEQARVLGVLRSQRFGDKSPAQIWATLLDEGTYLGVAVVADEVVHRVLRGGLVLQLCAVETQALLTVLDDLSPALHHDPEAGCGDRTPRNAVHLVGHLLERLVHGIADEPEVPCHGRIPEAVVGHDGFRIAADLAELSHTEDDARTLQFDDQMVPLALPVPRSPGQHEIDPAASPVLAENRFGRGCVTSE